MRDRQRPGAGGPSVDTGGGDAALTRQRLDLWLWHARIVRTRRNAAELVEAGYVRVDGMRVTAPSHAVRAGNVLTVSLDRRVRVLRVCGFAARRGDAHATRGLYQEINDHEAGRQ